LLGYRDRLFDFPPILRYTGLMELTKEYLKAEIGKAHELIFSGSLHEVDEATHILARLVKEIDHGRVQN